ncbi:MAG: hypothetical protein V7739_11965 [Motiliproteus sp.]
MLSNYLKNKHQQKFQQALLTADESLLRKTLGKGVDINDPFADAPDKPPQLPLFHAIQSCTPGCLQILLEAGARLPPESVLQRTLLEQAIRSTDQALALLTQLLSHGLDANTAEGSAFFYCLQNNNPSQQLLLLTRLMEHGGDINVRDDARLSVLDRLMIAEQTQLVGSLISAGALVSENLQQLACSDEIKAFAQRKKQDLEIQKMLLGG